MYFAAPHCTAPCCRVLLHCTTVFDHLTVLCVGDLASSEWWEKQDLVPPDPSPPENLQSVLADVFLEDSQYQQNPFPFPASQPLPNLHLPKTAPPHSLLVRQACLLSLCLNFASSLAYLTVLGPCLAATAVCHLVCVRPLPSPCHELAAGLPSMCQLNWRFEIG